MSDAVVPLLRQLRHPLWSPQAPKGFGDTTQEWADPDSLLNRAELARTHRDAVCDAQRDRSARRCSTSWTSPTSDPLHALLSDNSIAARERVALALAGPAFQWR